jgi:hypothetical protein
MTLCPESSYRVLVFHIQMRTLVRLSLWGWWVIARLPSLFSPRCGRLDYCHKQQAATTERGGGGEKIVLLLVPGEQLRRDMARCIRRGPESIVRKKLAAGASDVSQ